MKTLWKIQLGLLFIFSWVCLLGISPVNADGLVFTGTNFSDGKNFNSFLGLMSGTVLATGINVYNDSDHSTIICTMDVTYPQYSSDASFMYKGFAQPCSLNTAGTLYSLYFEAVDMTPSVIDTTTMSYKYGCTYTTAINYDTSATSDDGSCTFSSGGSCPIPTTSGASGDYAEGLIKIFFIPLGLLLAVNFIRSWLF